MTSKLFVKGVAIVVAIIVGVLYIHSLIYPNNIHSLFSVINSHKNNNPMLHSTIYQPLPSPSFFITTSHNVTDTPRQRLPPSSNVTDEPPLLTPPLTAVPVTPYISSLFILMNACV